MQMIGFDEKWDGLLPLVTGGIPFINFDSLQREEIVVEE